MSNRPWGRGLSRPAWFIVMALGAVSVAIGAILLSGRQMMGLG